MNTPVSNPLDNYPRVRSILYVIQWVVTGVQTVLSAAFTFIYGTPDDWPLWFLGSLAVTPVLWSYLGVTAQTNVDASVYPGAHDGLGDGELTITNAVISDDDARWAEGQ